MPCPLHRALGFLMQRAYAVLVVVLALFSVLFMANSAVAQSPNIVISQVYGGGGNGGATYTHDFVEFFNRGSTSASLNGMSLQYGSATGNFGQHVDLNNVTLAPGQYYLLQLGSQDEDVGSPLPITPDQSGGTNMGGTNGKVVLANTIENLGCGGTSGTGAIACTTEQSALFIDLVGFGSATLYEGSSATGALSSSTAAIRNNGGCTDTDNNGSDFTVTTPNPRNSSSPLNNCGTLANTPPIVSSTSPANGATNVAVSADLNVNFNEPVTLNGEWFTLSCATSTHAFSDVTVSGGPQSWTISPNTAFSDAEQCTLTIIAENVVDQDASAPLAMESDYSATFTTGYANPCIAPYTKIGAIQGTTDAAAITGPVTTMGVVIANYQGASPALRGYYLQSADGEGDGDPATSDGIFVFTGNDLTVSVGELLRVTGSASEYQGQTQLSGTSIVNCGTGVASPATVTLPVPAADNETDYLERFESMLVTIPQTLTVTDLYYYGRFHQIALSANGRLIQPTHLYPAADPARATLQEENNLRRILLDDPLNGQNLMPLTFGRNGNPFTVSPLNILRAGDTVSNITGVLNYTWGGVSSSPNAWRVRPTTSVMPNFQAVNERPAPLPRTAPLRVGSLNLLNFFNSFGETGCTGGVGGEVMECRGALSESDFLNRQVPKTVAALTKLDADIIAINEIENDGYGADSAIQALVNYMNAAEGADVWSFINPDAALGQTNTLGTDAIKVGIIYKPASVTVLGTAVLNTQEFVYTYDSEPRNRPALAQSFSDAYGAEVMIVVNHLKSKGSACIDDAASDGVQGNCNGIRTYATSELMSWVAGLPTGTDSGAILLVGDYNSYAKEDPIINITGPAQFTDLSAYFGGPTEYSYVYDGQWGYLDYAFASAQLLDRVVWAAPWHINADEATVLDHTTEYKTTTGQTALWEANEFRTSDHDPIVIDIEPPSYPLTVTVVANNGSSGSVSSTPAGISCGITCTAEFYQNSPITLTATADVTSHLVGWSEASCGASTTCSVPFTTTAKVVTATFDVNIYTVTTGTTGGGSGVVESSALTGTYGTAITLTATPETGSQLTGWSEGSCGTSTTCIITLTDDVTVTANFELEIYTVTTGTTGGGSGVVESSALTGTYGTAITLTATPETGSQLTGWSEVSCGTSNTCIITLTGDVTVTANFELEIYTVTTGTTGGGSGVVESSAPTGTYGTAITLTATPETGSQLTGWSEASCGTSTTCIITLTGDVTVTANFELEVYTLTTSVTGNGSVTSEPAGINCGDDCTESLAAGTVITLTATPAEGWLFSGWSGACTDSALTCVVTMSADTTVTAAFVEAEEMNLRTFLPFIFGPQE